jgi:hypothetical protein
VPSLQPPGRAHPRRASPKNLDETLAQPRATGHQITDEEIERLSPLQHEHIKMLGNFPFILPHEFVARQRRLLREVGQAA